MHFYLIVTSHDPLDLISPICMLKGTSNGRGLLIDVAAELHNLLLGPLDLLVHGGVRYPCDLDWHRVILTL